MATALLQLALDGPMTVWGLLGDFGHSAECTGAEVIRDRATAAVHYQELNWIVFLIAVECGLTHSSGWHVRGRRAVALGEIRRQKLLKGDQRVGGARIVVMVQGLRGG